jgi:hypothetical protein
MPRCCVLFAALLACVAAPTTARAARRAQQREGSLHVHPDDVAAATAPLLELLERLQRQQSLGGSTGAAEEEKAAPPRELLAAADLGDQVSGIRIAHNNSAIVLGAERDVRLVRSAEGTLTISDVVNITRSLVVSGVDVLDALSRSGGGTTLFCSEQDTLNASYHFAVYEGCNHAPAHGQYINAQEFGCFHGYTATPGNRWVCEEDGGVAVPAKPLCEPATCTAVSAAGFDEHGGEVADESQEVSTGDTFAATGDCLRGDYAIVEDNTWVCPGNGSAAHPEHDLCACVSPPCSDWVLLAADAKSFGTTTATSDALVGGTFTQFMVVYKSGYVTCTTSSSNLPSNPATYPWNACGTSLHTAGAFSLELKVNDKYIVEQTNWYTLPTACEKPQCPDCDIVCTANFKLVKGDDIMVTWYEPSHSTSTSDNGGTLVVDVFGWGVAAA